MTGMSGEIDHDDQQVLQLIYKKALEIESNTIKLSDLCKDIQYLNIFKENFIKSINVLRNYGYFDVEYNIKRTPISINISAVCFEEYARTYQKDYYYLFNLVPEKIVNETVLRSEDIAISLQMPLWMINLVLSYFIQNGFIKAKKMGKGNILICEISPPFKRVFKKK
ncbi:MAG: hypothetical protein ACE14P_02505 [Methanotrichaceae archaeon]